MIYPGGNPGDIKHKLFDRIALELILGTHSHVKYYTVDTLDKGTYKIHKNLKTDVIKTQSQYC